MKEEGCELQELRWKVTKKINEKDNTDFEKMRIMNQPVKWKNHTHKKRESGGIPDCGRGNAQERSNVQRKVIAKERFVVAFNKFVNMLLIFFIMNVLAAHCFQQLGNEEKEHFLERHALFSIYNHQITRGGLFITKFLPKWFLRDITQLYSLIDTKLSNLGILCRYI